MKLHNSGPTRNCGKIKNQYRVLKHKNITIDCTSSKNSCIFLDDGNFVKFKNIVESETDDIILIVKPFTKMSSVYDNPDSRNINIFIVASSRKIEISTPISNLQAKVWQIPTNEDIILIPSRHTVNEAEK